MAITITTIKELLQLYKGNESFIKFLIIGSNKFKEKKVGFKPGEKIYINKYKTVQLRQNEFLYRIYFLNCIVITIQKFIYDFISHIGIILPISMRMILIMLEMLFFLAFYDETYRQGISELYLPNTKELKKTEVPLFVINIAIFFIYTVSIWISKTNLDLGMDFMMLFMLVIFLVIFIITNEFHSRTNKKTIYSFVSNSNYNRSDDNINLERDIVLKLKNGTVYQVNLLISEFLFCDNDDIIILVSKGIDDTKTIKTNGVEKFMKSQKLKKETVDKISIGQVDLKYDAERGWYKV